uniref:RING-type domain-containing protein n=2 Tax=Octactis speculum TaxID=3111310 RepID=A0A7S2HS92_9STRA|mmetsp:Transcript_9087/g.11614  ORF Transcript_9087/g.11614 Transcript_9087/m.11614 type:complete len:1033 (+) Transcript_9087:3-3101(+)
MSANDIIARAKDLCRENGGGGAMNGYNAKKLQGLARACMRQLHVRAVGSTANPTKQWGQDMEAHGVNFIFWALAKCGKEFGEWASICQAAGVREVDAGLRKIGNMNMPGIIQHAGSHHNSVYDFDSAAWMKIYKVYQKGVKWLQELQGLPMHVTSPRHMTLLEPGPLLLRYIRDLTYRHSALGASDEDDDAYGNIGGTPASHRSSRGTTVVASQRSSVPSSEQRDAQRHYRARVAGFMAEVPRAGDSASSLDYPDAPNHEASNPSFPDESRDHLSSLHLDHEALPWTSELLEVDDILGVDDVEVLNEDEAAEEHRIYEYRQQHSTMSLPESRTIPGAFRTGSGLQSLLYGNVDPVDNEREQDIPRQVQSQGKCQICQHWLLTPQYEDFLSCASGHSIHEECFSAWRDHSPELSSMKCGLCASKFHVDNPNRNLALKMVAMDQIEARRKMVAEAEAAADAKIEAEDQELLAYPMIKAKAPTHAELFLRRYDGHAIGGDPERGDSRKPGDTSGGSEETNGELPTGPSASSPSNSPLKKKQATSGSGGPTQHHLGSASDLIDRQLAFQNALDRVEDAKSAIDVSRAASSNFDLSLVGSIFPALLEPALPGEATSWRVSGQSVLRPRSYSTSTDENDTSNAGPIGHASASSRRQQTAMARLHQQGSDTGTYTSLSSDVLPPEGRLRPRNQPRRFLLHTGTTAATRHPQRRGSETVTGPSSSSAVAQGTGIQTSTNQRPGFRDMVTPRALRSAFETPRPRPPNDVPTTSPTSPQEVRLGDAFHDAENPGGVLVVTLFEETEDGIVVNMIDIAYAALGNPTAKIITILLSELLDQDLDGGAYAPIPVVRLQQIARDDLRGRSLYELVMRAVKNIGRCSYPRSGGRNEETQALKADRGTMLGNLDRAFNGRPEYAPPPEVVEAQEQHRLGRPNGQGHGRPRAAAYGEAVERDVVHRASDASRRSGQVLLQEQSTLSVVLTQLEVVGTASMEQVKRAFVVHNYDKDGTTGRALRDLLRSKLAATMRHMIAQQGTDVDALI